MSEPLEGRWRVERLSGALPPMTGVRKEIHGDRGETRFGPFFRLSFQVEKRVDGFAFVYHPPLSMLVDEVRAGPKDSWRGGRSSADASSGGFGW